MADFSASKGIAEHLTDIHLLLNVWGLLVGHVVMDLDLMLRTTSLHEHNGIHRAVHLGWVLAREGTTTVGTQPPQVSIRPASAAPWGPPMMNLPDGLM